MSSTVLSSIICALVRDFSMCLSDSSIGLKAGQTMFFCRMKIFGLSEDNLPDGAARVAYRLQKAVQRMGYELMMCVESRTSDEASFV